MFEKNVFSARNTMQKICLTLIFVYQHCVSLFLKPACRFYPSCSNYAAEAILKHGAIRGIYFSIKRLLRCHPFCRSSGFDPVPNFNSKEKNHGY